MIDRKILDAIKAVSYGMLNTAAYMDNCDIIIQKGSSSLKMDTSKVFELSFINNLRSILSPQYEVYTTEDALMVLYGENWTSLRDSQYGDMAIVDIALKRVYWIDLKTGHNHCGSITKRSLQNFATQLHPNTEYYYLCISPEKDYIYFFEGRIAKSIPCYDIFLGEKDYKNYIKSISIL